MLAASGRPGADVTQRVEQAGAGADGTRVVPLYHRVYLLLLQAISDRTYPPDVPMPGEFELADQMGVSRVTLRAALKRLEQEGLVQRQRGRGTFPVPERLARLEAMPGMRNQVSLALKTGVQVLEYAIVPVADAVASLLQVKAGDRVLRIVRLRYDAASPISHSVCHVPLDLAPLLPKARLRSLPVSSVLASAGVALDAFREQISACIASLDVAAALKVPVGGPLLSMDRSVLLEDGRVAEQLRVLYRPDRYCYNIEYAAGETRTRMSDQCG